MSAETDIAALDNGGANTVAEVRTALTSVLARADLSTRIGARVRNSANQTLSDGVSTSITFDTEDFDSHGFHEGVTNPERLTIPSGLGGLYLVGGAVQFAADADGRRIIAIRVNADDGETFVSEEATPTAVAIPMSVISAPVVLAAGDFLELRAFQNAGGNLDSIAVAKRSPLFWCVRLSD